MSELLLHWLNNDVQLTSYVTNVESDFSSGFLLGEILHRLNQQHNFTDFMNSTIADAKIINFCLLEPTFRHLNIPFDSKIATAIMNGKSGAAANVLYQIKMASERIARAPGVSTKSLERTNIHPLHNIPAKLAKPSYDAAHHYFFEHSVRRQVKSLTGLRRERETIEMDTRRKLEYREKQARIQAELEITKAERLHRAFLHSEYIKTALEETDSPAWRLALQKQSEREHRRAAFYQQLMSETNRKQQQHTFSLRRTVEHDLDEFERRGSPSSSKATNDGGGSNSLPSRKSAGYGLRSLSTTLETHTPHHAPREGLADPTKSIALGETTAALVRTSATIRDQRHHRERRREQFERRWKRFLQDALHIQTQRNAGTGTHDLEELVQRVTHRERESHSDLAKILIYKEIATDNRKRRDESYATRRELDDHEAIDRDSAAFELLFAKYNDDWELLNLHSEHHRVATQAAQQYENLLVVGLVLHELVELAMVTAGDREDARFSKDESSASFLFSDETWEETKFQFATRGLQALAKRISNNAITNDCTTGETRFEKDLDDEETHVAQYQLATYLHRFLPSQFTSQGPFDYVGAVGKRTAGGGGLSALSPWVARDRNFLSAVDVLEACFVLGETVKYLRWLAHAETPTSAPPAPPQTNLAIEAQAEAETGAVATPVEIEPSPAEPEAVEVNTEVAAGETLIEALSPEVAATLEEPSLSSSPSPPSTPEPVVTPALPRLCILLAGPPFAGKATQAEMLAKTYELAVLSVEQLLLQAISSPDSSASGAEAQELLNHGQEIPPRVYSALVSEAIQQLDVLQQNRWILHDLPCTAAHAQSLEEHLTGFVEPSSIKSPYDYESLLAPGCRKPTLPRSFLYGQSGLDLVFYLDCGADSAPLLERCLGKLEDHETHEQLHHLLFSPPATDATHRHRLQHVNTSSNATALLSLQVLSSREFATSQKQWFRQFDTLRDVATTQSHEGQSIAITRAMTEEATHARLVELVDAFFDQQRVAQEDLQRERELEEAVAMQREESRQLKLTELKNGITLAQQDVTKAQQAVQQAEESKAKKEELSELRTIMESAKKHVESALLDARDWLFEETLQTRNSRSTYSARLLPPLATALASVWDTMEREYTKVMQNCLHLQRQQRQRVESRVQWVLETVCTHLVRRIDTKQRIVNLFQTQFNDVLEEMRFDDATKNELHARTDVLQDDLCAVVSDKKRESEDELREIMGDGWIEDTCQWIALICQRALQAECDRFRVSLQLLVDAFSAASDEPAQLMGIAEQLSSNPALLLELTVKTFVDVHEQPVAAAAPVAPVPAAAPPAKGGAAGKGGPAAAGKAAKPPLVHTPSVHASAASATEVMDPLAVATLVLAYETVLQRSDTLVQAILNAPPKLLDSAKPPEPAAAAVPSSTSTKTSAGKTGATPVATPSATPVSSMALLPRQSIDVATSNFQKAVQYEQENFQRRVHFLKDTVHSACDHVARALRCVESTLRDVIEQRALREHAAVASLVGYVRSAIEAQIDLPFYLDVQPQQVCRFPTPAHVIEDTRVVVDSHVRLVPRAPVDTPPQIEVFHDVLLNERQRGELLVRLGQGTALIAMEVVQILMALTTVPHALPTQWQHCSEVTFAKIVAVFADPQSGLVDRDALVSAISTDEEFLRSNLQHAVATDDTETIG